MPEASPALRVKVRISDEMRALWRARGRPVGDTGTLAGDAEGRYLSDAGTRADQPDPAVPDGLASLALLEDPAGGGRAQAAIGPVGPGGVMPDGPGTGDLTTGGPGTGGTGTGDTGTDDPTGTRPDGDALIGCVPTAIRRGPTRDIRIRIDGLRPLRFRGLSILAGQTRRNHRMPDGTELHLSQRLELYLAEDGDLVAATSVEADGCGIARPVYRGLRSQDQDAVVRFIRSHAPAEVFLDPAPMPGDRASHISDICSLLGRDFADAFGFAVRGASASKG